MFSVDLGGGIASREAFLMPVTGKRERSMLAKNCLKVLAAIATGTMVAHASAAVVLSENFESNPVVASTPPAAANPNQPAVAAYAGTPRFTGVSVETGTGAGFGNFVALDSAGQSTFNDDASNVRGLHLFDGDSAGGNTAPNARYQFAAIGSGVKVGNAVTPNPTAPNFTFSFDFNIGPGSPDPEGTASSVNTFNAIVRLDNGASANAGPGLVIDRNEDGDIFTRTTGGNGAQIGFDLADSTWFRAIFTINAPAGTYSVQIVNEAGTVVSTLAGSTNLAFEGNGDGTPNDITEFTQIFVTDNNGTGAGGDFFMDNLQVETLVPEPASLGVTALGAAAFIRRRR